ncbi:hypothetical protein FHR83_007029 [Actinoplanes campanulatus]|uniref:Uncharacterized protein n=1 Tax=Actinoplanes campanulatus TaxID=113559 RepID=A0A7W5FI42_9ACTN|nr:hypothetical protein [Actinoplanes campanulatus]MBB3099323.1 hypothetical protein [Actinoplanes campanulatus]GGN40475.1 hypothetical protein GCM10010109_69620 [Actinoplanes campanulatus]GID40641.1 hypothetical protein Aca09nite_71470 [Actinoplanes campanulatus]
MTTEIRTDGHFDPCIGGGSSRDCERGECNARAMCAAADLSARPSLVAGYDRAVAVLQGVAARTGSDAARWAADYLAADPDRWRQAERCWHGEECSGSGPDCEPERTCGAPEHHRPTHSRISDGRGEGA